MQNKNQTTKQNKINKQKTKQNKKQQKTASQKKKKKHTPQKNKQYQNNMKFKLLSGSIYWPIYALIKIYIVIEWLSFHG